MTLHERRASFARPLQDPGSPRSHPSLIDETAVTREAWKVFQIMAEFVEGFEVVDNPKDVVDAIFKYYGHCGFDPSAEEQEILLHL